MLRQSPHSLRMGVQHAHLDKREQRKKLVILMYVTQRMMAMSRVLQRQETVRMVYLLSGGLGVPMVR